MHIGSGVDYRHLEQVCGAMVELVRTTHAAGHDLHAISAGGGLSIPYRDGEPVIDTQHYHGLWDAARQQAEAIVRHPLGLEIEPGRYLVAESGVLLGEVRATKDAGNNHFMLLDTGFNELMRPSMYGSYHTMSVLRRDGSTAADRPSVVAGPLCESGDVFTQGDGGVVLPRNLPDAQVGDLLVIHDAGAYGASMSSNYNTRPLIAEVLVDGGQARLIRRRQTVEELLALELGL
jgi:diaminopimelate decarboxylase